MLKQDIVRQNVEQSTDVRPQASLNFLLFCSSEANVSAVRLLAVRDIVSEQNQGHTKQEKKMTYI